MQITYHIYRAVRKYKHVKSEFKEQVGHLLKQLKIAKTVLKYRTNQNIYFFSFFKKNCRASSQAC